MGQYYYIVNLDKKEYLSPHDFHCGAKLCELGAQDNSTLAGLAILLSSGNGKGGGDIDSDNALIGSWAGDRIVISGDYAESMLFLDEETKSRYLHNGNEDDIPNLYNHARETFKNISADVVEILKSVGLFHKK